jgi:hypothetical protein
VELADELAEAARAAASRGEVTGVLAAEPSPGRRLYLVALGPADEAQWLVLDREGRVQDRREDVRATASIIALCELAGDLAGGGDLAGLRQQLAQLRIVENPEGIDEAEEAATLLERVIGQPPRVASPGYLDDLGAATAELERALGDHSSPFSAALRAGTGAVDEFVRDVERGYLVELR